MTTLISTCQLRFVC